MDGLALKIIWKDRYGNANREWAVLNTGQSISIERTNPCFNESGTYSYPFALPYEENKHIFGELKLPESERGIEDIQYTFELYCKGVFMFMGDLDIDEGEIDDSIDLQLRSGNNSFWNKIEGMNCRDVEQAEEVVVGENVYKPNPNGGRGTYHFTPFYNIDKPYPSSNFCNVRTILNPVLEYDEEDEQAYMTPIIEPDSAYSGICFYVMYLLECLFKMQGIEVLTNDMLSYEDFKRLAFFVTFRDTRGGSIRGTETGYQYATSKNFPDKLVSEVFESFKAAFGVVLIHDEYSNSVKIRLLKNVLTGFDSSILSSRVLSVEKTLEKKQNIIVKYSGDDKDTAYTYTDYTNIIEMPDYNTIVDMYKNDELRDDDIFCYIDLKTGNAYRVKVDEETNTDPVIFEVGQFNSYSSIKNSNSTKEIEEIVIDFSPVVINDITSETVRKKNNYDIETAIYVNFDLEKAERSTSLRTDRGVSATSRNTPSTRADYETQRRPGTGPYKISYLYSSLFKHDTGFALGIMRGPGSNETIDTSIDEYEDQIGGNSFVKIAGTLAFTSDSIDAFGRDYDYNGAAGGVGNDPLKDRFSLKLKVTKPEYTASVYPDRGLIDTFLSEYLYFLQNRRIIKLLAEISLTDLVSIDWTKKYHIGEYFGFINKLSFSLNNEGISNTEVELYMI